MNIHESGEDYLETILRLQERLENVRSVDIANELAYSKASVSRAVKILKENGYILINYRGYITLTEKGKHRASMIFERHQTLMDFFINVLKLDPELAEKDACRIEHAISEETFNSFKKYLNEKGERICH